MTGLDVVRLALADGKATEAILVTGYPSPESVAEAICAGARGYVVKPVDDADLLRSLVRAALDRDRLRQLVAALGGELRPWAERALAAARSADSSRALVEALQILTQRPEGPARIGVVAERALVAPLSLAGHRAEGPWDPPRALSAAAAGEVEALVVGEGVPPAEARDLTRMVLDDSWPPAVVWAQAPGDFEAAQSLMSAEVASVVSRPVDSAAIAAAVSRAVERRRRELRPRALGVVLEALKIGVI
jgi:DNA-binding NtrC family response regulator